MECPEINNLVLSDGSRKAIERIKRIPGLANRLASATAASQVVVLFVSPTPPAATLYSVHSTEWKTFATAMASVPSIARGSMQREAWSAWQEAQLRNNHAESQFWEAVANGCQLR